VTAARRRPVAFIARCTSARLTPAPTVRPASRPNGAAAPRMARPSVPRTATRTAWAVPCSTPPSS